MPLIMEIERFEFDSFEKDGKTYHYARMRGHDSHGHYRRAICYTPVAEELKRQLEQRLQPGEDVVSHRFMVELDGEFRERPRKSGDREWVERSYNGKSFKLLTGPSVEMARSKKNANVALNAARKALEDEDLKSAYLALEGFAVQMTGQPAPSSGMDLGEEDLIADDASPVTSTATVSEESIAVEAEDEAPEERAMARLAARGAAVETRTEESVAAEAVDDVSEAKPEHDEESVPETVVKAAPVIPGRRMPQRPPAIPARGTARPSATGEAARDDDKSEATAEPAPVDRRPAIPRPMGLPRGRGM